MFNKLVGLIQGEKTSHPLGSADALAQTLSEIPTRDANRVLAEADNLIEDPQRYDTELSAVQLLQAIIEIDAFAREAYRGQLQRFLLPGTHDHNSDLLWAVLERHQRLAHTAYAYALRAFTPGTEAAVQQRPLIAQGALRAMMAWVEWKKLQHFRYRPPELEWWLTAHQLVGVASQHAVLGQVLPPFPDEGPARSCLHAYLAGLYLEMAPMANLVPVQVEVLSNWLQQHASVVEFSEVPHPGTTHFISLQNPGQPTLYGPSVTPNSALRFCSTRRLRPALLMLSKHIRRQEPAPDWLTPYLGQREALEVLLDNLLRYWADQRPERAATRTALNEGLRVVHGLDLARRMIACTAFAKEGRTLRYRRADWEQLFNEQRFGRVDQQLPATEDDVPVDPMETLQKLETAGDQLMMEQWTLVDQSETGVGAIAMGLRSRNRIGELVGYRIEGDIEWRIGVIRRIGRDSRKRASIGLQSLPMPAVCAQGRSLAQRIEGKAEAQSFFDAILLASVGNELLLPLGVFAVNLLVRLDVGGQQQEIVLTEKVDRGSDWVRARFKPAGQDDTNDNPDNNQDVNRKAE